MSRPTIHQLQQTGATNGQGIKWDSTLGLWIPANVVRGLTSADATVTVADNGDGTLDLHAASGSGGGTTYPLDPTAPTDTFSGSSLAAAWNFAGSYVAGDFTVANSFVACASPRAAGNYVWRTPPGSWTTITAKMSSSCVGSTATGQAFGLVAVDSTGAGVGAASAYNGTPDGIILGNLAAGAFSSGFQTSASVLSSLGKQGIPHWLRLRRSGTSWFASASLNGVNWAPETPAQTNAATITRIGFGGWFAQAPNSFSLDWFNVA